MGPYCRYCDQRCFALRVLHSGETVLLATCPRGMAHDRKVTGQDHTTAVNPALRERMATPGYMPTLDEALEDPAGFVEGMTEL